MKTCFKCQMNLPITEFYVHPRMADGHLGKCKKCTRKDTADHNALKSSTDLEWLLAERERHRLKSIRRRQEGRHIVSISSRRLALLKSAAKYPEKTLARRIVGNAIRDGKLLRQPCEKCGKKAQAHHDDYSRPLAVRWLCPSHHAEHHRNERDAAIIASFKP